MNKVDGVADHLGKAAFFAASLRREQLPEAVVTHAKLLLLDTIGVMVAGAREKRISRLSALVRQRGSAGRSFIIGDGGRGDAADAALVNGTACCIQVLEEGHKYARGHVGAYVIPAVIAVAEERGASGGELLTAIVAGYELAARMGMACRVREAMHPNGTWGTVGAAAVVARLMSYDASQIRETMNVVAPLTLATSWQTAVEGATVRDLFTGVGGETAIRAARWVENGFSGCNDDVSHVFGHVSSEQFDASALSRGLGTDWEILRNYFKIHACCRNFQSAIDAALALKAEHTFAADDIAHVTVATFNIPPRDNASMQANNVLAARESLPISMALTLIHNDCGPSTFTDDRVYAEGTQLLAEKVELFADPSLEALFPEQRPSRVTIALKDGRTIESYAEVARGDPAWPLTRPDIEQKFMQLTSESLGSAAGDLRSAVDRLDQLASASELTRYLTTQAN